MQAHIKMNLGGMMTALAVVAALVVPMAGCALTTNRSGDSRGVVAERVDTPADPARTAPTEADASDGPRTPPRDGGSPSEDEPVSADATSAMDAGTVVVADDASDGSNAEQAEEPASGFGERGGEESVGGLVGGNLIEVFPGIRVAVAQRVLEFDARISPLLHDELNPTFYLEQLVCTPDTKAHESLLITDAVPSEIHAAMLMAGFEPGMPGLVWQEFGPDGEVITSRRPPRGDRVRVRFRYTDPLTGAVRSIDPLSWVEDHETGEAFGDSTLLFTGSELREAAGGEVYAADRDGTIVGLTTFGTETIGIERVISHESAIDEPVWVADVDRVPKGEVRVVVRISGG